MDSEHHHLVRARFRAYLGDVVRWTSISLVIGVVVTVALAELAGWLPGGCG